jgi:feruloyl-CoA synthase
LCPDAARNGGLAEVVAQPAVRARMQQMLDTLAAQSTGSATRIQRAVIADVPPSGHAGELTDKGSLNQRAVLRNRPELVDELYGEPPSPRVLVAARKG